MMHINSLDDLNFLVSRRPWRLFEISDQWFFPPFLRACCQTVLASQWSSQIPFIQQVAPAERAARIVEDALDQLESEETDFGKPVKPIHVIDFCSGAGGPTPVIEQVVNRRRLRRELKPVNFLMSDLHPHLDDWIESSQRSDYLSFIPQSVDATDPPASAMSASARSSGPYSSDARILRLYCLSFHHFDDDMALKVLSSTLETSDGFVILELQDRRLASLILMILQFFFVWVVSVFRFFDKPLHLIFTYVLPILPFVMSFDGFISSLRTRTFDELLQLVVAAHGKRPPAAVISSRSWMLSNDYGDRHRTIQVGDWLFEGARQVHTWPLGHLNWFVGRRRAH